MLSPGDRLGRYEVVSPLGAGGMGEVYRARDTELQREVALKILPEALSLDPDRLRRFEREAKVTAALSHPNVLTVFDVGHEAGRTYLVVEILEGSTIAEVIKDGALRTREALDYAAQVARGLAAVHAHGIVHRDLKPANLFLTTTGVVKILDFGLARIGAAGFQSAEETTAEVTGPGLVLGTVSYMSPEQARGDPPDARSDLFSLGTVLYEMLSGRHPFRRSSSAETATAILRDAPADLGRVEGEAPGAIKRLVGRCLEKRQEDRFQTATDLALALDMLCRGEEWAGTAASADPTTQRHATAGGEPTKAVSPARRWIAIGILAAVALLTAAAWLRWPRETELPPPRLVPLTSLRGSEMNPTFSPDGGQIAFAWEGEKGNNTDIYLKMIGASEIRRLTSDPAVDAAPSWSPDGRQIAFLRLRSGGLWRIPDFPSTIHLVSPVGGSERRLSDFPARDSQLSWSPDGRWLAAARFAAATEKDPRAAGIYLVPVLGGEPRCITSPRASTFHTDPALSRDGRHLAYATCRSFLSCQIDVVELDRDYLPTTTPRRLTRRAGWIRGLAWARDGNSLVYGDATAGRLWRTSILGNRPPEKIELAGLYPFEPATAASLDRLAFVQSRSSADVYRFELGHPPEPLLVSSSGNHFPHLSPSGRRIAFQSGRAGDGSEIWLADVDGSNPAQLTRGPGIGQGSPRWSPDGRRIAFDSQREDGRWDIWTIDADGGSPSRLTPDSGDENMPSWSRDGLWIYFTSDRAGAPPDVWRIPATGGPEERVTHGGGSLAYESADGKTLFYMRAFAKAPLFALSLGGGPERKVLECVPAQSFAVGPAGVYHFACEAGPSGTPLYLLDPATGRDLLLGSLEGAGGGLTVSPDGKTILYGKRVGEGSDLMMIENFR